jgi:hypothetical protein
VICENDRTPDEPGLNNVPSILRHGILAHSQVEARGIDFKPIYDVRIFLPREKQIPDAWLNADFLLTSKLAA